MGVKSTERNSLATLAADVIACCGAVRKLPGVLMGFSILRKYLNCVQGRMLAMLNAPNNFEDPLGQNLSSSTAIISFVFASS